VDAKALATPELQSTLLAEAIESADVGFLVWDDDRHYIAVNDRACELLGCTREQLLGSRVGERTPSGDAAVEAVVRDEGGRGTLAVERFDGRTIRLGYVSFATRTSSLPYLASVIWEEPG
jgi:PAS domain S-box-containing protein